ncbi:MAG: hypothetical protein J6386_09270 [Candidatus Synoicihabitans palmerolidicus]|nr:hypothetical protein [Candidatus Synoicihabitans palmerolidicus]
MGTWPESTKLVTRSRKGYWQLASNSIVQRALNNDWLTAQGVPDMKARWIARHYANTPQTEAM